MTNDNLYVINPNFDGNHVSLDLVSVDELDLPQSTNSSKMIINTDCTSVIQEMVDSLPNENGVLEFPPGKYYISDTINLTKNNVKVLGNNTTLTFLTSSVLKSKMFVVSSGNNIEFSNLTLDGNRYEMVEENKQNFGLYFQYCNDVKLNNITCNNFSLNSLTINNCKNVNVYNSHFDKNGWSGMEIMTSNKCNFYNTTFNENGYGGIKKFEDFEHGFVSRDNKIAFGVTVRFNSYNINFYDCDALNNGRDGFNVNQGSYDINYFNCICNGNNDGGFTIAADSTFPNIPGDGISPYNINYFNCIAENNLGSGLVAYQPVKNVFIQGGKYYNNRRATGWEGNEEETSCQPNIYFAAKSSDIVINNPKCYDDRQLCSIFSAKIDNNLLIVTTTCWNSQYDKKYPGIMLLNNFNKFIAYGEIVNSTNTTITIKPTNFNTFDVNTILNKITNGYITQKKVSVGILFDHACQAVVNVDNFGDGFLPNSKFDFPVKNIWSSYLPNNEGFTNVKVNSGILLSPNIILNGQFKNGLNNWKCNVIKGDQPSMSVISNVEDSPYPNVCNMDITYGTVIDLYPEIDNSIGFKNRYISFGGWVKSNKNYVLLQSYWYLKNNQPGMSQVQYTNINQWQWLELNGLMSDIPYGIRLHLYDDCNVQLTGFVCSVKQV